ncbi:ADYC domain-containing protein [Sorangium sp. So ce128]|uniref:ADYC domain-containing protein n=1 Tax=Sorangium sp. So ce128 TaxID=3133281 RepID=UPI003F631624
MRNETWRGERRGRGVRAAGGASAAWRARSMLALLAAGACGACALPEPGDPEDAAQAAPDAPPSGIEAGGAGEPAGALPPGAATGGAEGDTTYELPDLRALLPYDPTKRPGSNGPGIYVMAASDSTYCFLNDQGVPSFCPERFVNAGGSVKLEFRSATRPTALYSSAVSASRKLPGEAAFRPVVLRSVRAVGMELEIEYALDGVVFPPIRGAALSSFKLEVAGPGGLFFRYELMVEPPGPAPLPPPAPDPEPRPWLRRYNVKYRVVPAGADPSASRWRRHCSVARVDLRASFAGESRVDGLFATVARDASATTMSCETGAIDACLSWGYAPWRTETASADEGRFLFGACLHAKRAAYFAGPAGGAERTTSFTRPGTPIVVRDKLGILPGADPTHLEAIWSPEGAKCLNVENLRISEFHDHVASLSSLPPCTAHWSTIGAFATGRVGPPGPSTW